MTYLIFNTESAATEAQDQIFFNEMANIAANNAGKIFTNDLQEVDFSSLTREQVLDLRIFYYKGGKKVFDSGFVTQIVSVKKAFEIEKWFFEKTGIIDNIVFDEEISEIPAEWIEPMVATDPSTLPEGVTMADIVQYPN